MRWAWSTAWPNPAGPWPTRWRLAATLNERAPNALASIKELLSEAPGQTLDAQLGAERDHFVRNLQHANAGEGIAAFLEKRAPRYQ